MKIAFTGTHSTGKTTLVNKLKENDLFKDYFFDINVTRRIHENGIPINQESTEFSQECNFNARVVNLFAYENYIGDRSIFDNMAYTKYQTFDLGKISEDFYNQQKRKLKEFFNGYDIIFFLPKDLVGFENDGTRSTNIEYRDRIEKYIMDDLDDHMGKFAQTYIRYMASPDRSIRERPCTRIYTLEDNDINKRIDFVISKIENDPLFDTIV